MANRECPNQKMDLLKCKAKTFTWRKAGQCDFSTCVPQQSPNFGSSPLHSWEQGVSSSSSFAAISSCQLCRKARGSWSVTQMVLELQALSGSDGAPKVKINQGQVFCLPSRIPHSPQRPEALRDSGTFPLSPNIACATPCYP